MKAWLKGVLIGAGILIIVITLIVIPNSKKYTGSNNGIIFNELTPALQDNVLNCVKNGESVCMPWDPSGKCFHYSHGAKSCRVVVNQILEGNFTTNLCYELEKEFLIGYCLARTNLDECFEYANENPLAEQVCKTIDCQINGRDAYPSELNLSDVLESLKYKNCVDVWESN
jgi:hypothetical protein